MIGHILTYVNNIIPTALRRPKLVAFIYTMLSGTVTTYNSLRTYINDARIRASATWQVCWLEKLLRDTIGGSPTIIESDGEPYDFIVMGVSYENETIARGILNRYKLGGKSYLLDFDEIEVSAQWSDHICAATNVYDFSVQWSNHVCASQEEAIVINVSLTWSDQASGSLDGASGYIQLIGSNEVDRGTLPNFSKIYFKALSGDHREAGYKVNFSNLMAFLSGLQVPKYIRWDTDYNMSNPSYDSETGFYTANTTIFIEIQTTPFT